MIMKRAYLHKTKLEDFKAWMIENGIAFRPGKGTYQVLQVLTDSGWQVIFSKNEMPEHFSVNEKLIPTIQRYIAERKAK